MANKNLFWVALVLVGAYLLVPAVQTSVNGFFQGFGGAGTTTTGTPVTNVNLGQCLDDLISYTSDDARKNLLGTNPSLNYRLFIGKDKTANLGSFPDGFADKGATADAGTVSVPTEVPYLEIAGWNSGTDNLVYRQKLTGSTGCNIDPLSISPQLAYGDANLTVYITDQDGSLNDAIGDAFNITQGQDFSFTVTIYTSTDFYWGNPYISGNKNLMIVYYNSSLYDDIKIPSLTQASVPDIARNNGSGWNRKAFAFPSLTSSQFSFKVDADVGGSDTPRCQTHFQRNNIYFQALDANIDVNGDNNALIEDVEDEDNNNLGAPDSLNMFAENVGCG